MLLLHGVEHHRPRNHWLWLLAESLRSQRVPVQYPQLPDPDAPRLERWLEVARAEIGMLGDGDRVVITHSLGGLLWSHLVPTLEPAKRPSRVLIVAPPSPDVLWDVIAHFSAAADARPGDLVPTTILGREKDPYRSISLPELATQWGAEAVVLPGEGHLTPDDGHGPLPWVERWILDR